MEQQFSNSFRAGGGNTDYKNSYSLFGGSGTFNSQRQMNSFFS